MDTYFKVHHHWNIDRKKITLYLQVQNALNTDQSISIIGWEPKTSNGTAGCYRPLIITSRGSLSPIVLNIKSQHILIPSPDPPAAPM